METTRKGPFKLVTVNTAPERAKRLIGRMIENLKEEYDIEYVANCESESHREQLNLSLIEVVSHRESRAGSSRTPAGHTLFRLHVDARASTQDSSDSRASTAWHQNTCYTRRLTSEEWAGCYRRAFDGERTALARFVGALNHVSLFLDINR
jgi:hypothetical protein